MKKFINTNCKLTTLLLLFNVTVYIAYSQNDISETISKSYDITGNTYLNIDSKYGDVDIKAWEKNKILIDVEIIIYDVSQEKGEQILEKVNIDFSRDGNQIRAQTRFDENFFQFADKNNHNRNKRFSIKYSIMMPPTVSTDIENKYGDVFIHKLISKSVIKVKYGGLMINDILSEGKDDMTEIDLAYSKGSIENCQWVKVNCKYSKLNIQKSKAAIIISKYSKLHIEQASSIVSESKYDAWHIGSISNIVTEAQYSNFRIEEAKKKILMDIRYTDVKVNRVPAQFKSIEIDNNYGSINISIEPGASYRLKGNARYAKIKYPSNSRVSRFQENSLLRVDGVVGSEKNNIPEVKIETQYGGISLIE